MAGDEFIYKQYKCDGLDSDSVWVRQTFDGINLGKYPQIPVLENGELFIYKKELVE